LFEQGKVPTERSFEMSLWHWFQEGGWWMFFVLAFGLITVAAALDFAWRPSEPRLAAVRAFSRTTVFSSLAALSLNLATVAHAVARPSVASSPNMHAILLEGIGESLTPTTLGLSLVSFAWLVVAAGERRRARNASRD
jgi:hypothetical protein